MDFSFSDDQKQLRELARKILEDRVTNDRLKSLERGGVVFDAELWAELAKYNLLGISLPESAGGMGFGFFELCLFLQECGRTVAPVPALATLGMAAPALAAFGTPAQQNRWLPEVAAGTTLLSAGLHELDSDDPRRPSTRARLDGSVWRIDGIKTAVPAAAQATRILVPAAFGDSGDVGLFWIDPSDSGATVRTQKTTDRQPHAQLELTAAAAEPLGDMATGRHQLEWLVQHATVAVCAVQLGVSERALEMTARYTSERKQFDRPVGSFQAVHQRAGDAFIQVEAIRLATWEAAWRLGQGELDAETVEVAKYWAAEGGQFTAYACQHLHGGIGIDIDYPLHRYFLWSIQLEHTLGCARQQLARIGARMADAG